MGETFKMRLCNIPPAEKVKITLKYIDQLKAHGVHLGDPRFKNGKATSAITYVLPTVLRDCYYPCGKVIFHFQALYRTRTPY